MARGEQYNSRQDYHCAEGSILPFWTSQGVRFQQRFPVVAEEFKQFMATNEIRHIRSSPYHPASNGWSRQLRRPYTLHNNLVFPWKPHLHGSC